MAVEVCFLLDASGAVLWSDRSDGPAALPDSRTRWEAIWRHRDELAEIAHSHPRGPLAFSAEDETTMGAIDAALGRRLAYCVVTPDAVLRGYAGRHHAVRCAPVAPEPSWAARLRVASGLIDRRDIHGEEAADRAADGDPQRDL